MLQIELERAMVPEDMSEQPCGICGVDFNPDAVLACLVTPHEYLPTCEVCLSHLARRAETEAIPASSAWSRVYADYVLAVAKYPEPLFPSLKAVLEFEKNDPRWSKIDRMRKLC